MNVTDYERELEKRDRRKSRRIKELEEENEKLRGMLSASYDEGGCDD